MQYGDYQLEIYGAGLQGVLPRWPVDFAGLEAAAGASLPDWILNYVAGGAGDERTQRGNAEAFGWWGIVPRMMNGAYERDLTTTICGVDLPTPLFCCPIGVIGLCSQDFHGDLAVARACARTGVPMVMSTLSQDPLEDVAAALGNTPGFFQLYTPKDRDVAVSLIQRAEKAGFRGLVVTLDTWVTGWRPRDLNTANFPQLRGTASRTTSPTRRSARCSTPHPRRTCAARSGCGRASSGTASPGTTSPGCARPPTCRSCSRGSATPTTPGARWTSAWTGSTAPTTAAGRPTAGCRRWRRCRRSSRRQGTCRCCSTRACARAPTSSKALALGASAVGLGRPYAYALAIGGEDGVVHHLRSVLAETDLIMAVDGYPTLADLRADGTIRRLPHQVR